MFSAMNVDYVKNRNILLLWIKYLMESVFISISLVVTYDFFFFLNGAYRKFVFFGNILILKIVTNIKINYYNNFWKE